MVVFFLHAFNRFFFLCPVSQHFQQADCLYVFVLYAFECVFHPAVAFASRIDKEVCGRQFCHVLYAGIVTVQVYAVIKQQGNAGFFGLVAQNVLHPVIFGEDCGDYVEFSVRCFFAA